MFTKKSYKKVFIFFTVLLSLIFSGLSTFATNTNELESIKQKSILSIATNAEFPPFEYKEGNEVKGIDIDISKKIAEKLGVELRINDVSFDAVILELLNGKSDFAIAAMCHSEERAKSVDFSEDYYTAKQVVITLPNDKIVSINDLEGKKIGVCLGFSGDVYCTKNYDEALISRYNKATDAVSDLIVGRVEAVILDDMPAFRIKNLHKDKIKILEDSLYEEKYRIAVPKGENELLNYINSAITELKKNGEIEKIASKYLNEEETSNNNFFDEILNNLIHEKRYMMILGGILITSQITFVALLIGVAIGLLMALIKINKSKKSIFKILKVIANGYINIIRGTPLVIQLFVIYYLILGSTGLSKILISMVAFGINSGAYVAEIMRSGFQSVSSDQYEAGRSLGLSGRQTMLKIIFPQAFKNVVPTLANEFINLVKETAIVGFIGIVDLSRAADIIRSQTYQPLVPLLTVALIYFIVITIINWIFKKVERRMGANDQH